MKTKEMKKYGSTLQGQLTDLRYDIEVKVYHHMKYDNVKEVNGEPLTLRDSDTSRDILTMDQVADSFAKVQEANVVMSIAKSVPPQAQNNVNLTVLKNGGIKEVWVGERKLNQMTTDEMLQVLLDVEETMVP